MAVAAAKSHIVYSIVLYCILLCIRILFKFVADILINYQYKLTVDDLQIRKQIHNIIVVQDHYLRVTAALLDT
jgi:hypothetical protein